MQIKDISTKEDWRFEASGENRRRLSIETRGGRLPLTAVVYAQILIEFARIEVVGILKFNVHIR